MKNNRKNLKNHRQRYVRNMETMRLRKLLYGRKEWLVGARKDAAVIRAGEPRPCIKGVCHTPLHGALRAPGEAR